MNEEKVDPKKKTNVRECEEIKLDNEKIRNELTRQIPTFLNQLTTKESIKKSICFKLILQVLLGGPKKRDVIIRTVCGDILNDYVKSINI